MSKVKTYCLIRDLAKPNFPSVVMDCEVLLARAKSGEWGQNWQIEESVSVVGQSINVLRVIGKYKENIGFEFILKDERYDEYFRQLKMSAPKSKALQLLRKPCK